MTREALIHAWAAEAVERCYQREALPGLGDVIARFTEAPDPDELARRDQMALRAWSAAYAARFGVVDAQKGP